MRSPFAAAADAGLGERLESGVIDPLEPRHPLLQPFPPFAPLQQR